MPIEPHVCILARERVRPDNGASLIARSTMLRPPRPRAMQFLPAVVELSCFRKAATRRCRLIRNRLSSRDARHCLCLIRAYELREYDDSRLIGNKDHAGNPNE